MPTELTTPRLHLDAWRDDDIDDYDTLVNERDPRTAAAAHGGRPTREELRETILRQQGSHADTGIGLLVIRTADSFAGYCGLTMGRASLAKPELAYELLRMNQGNGYATEAARATIHAAASTGRLDSGQQSDPGTTPRSAFWKRGLRAHRPHYDGRLRRHRLVHARALTALHRDTIVACPSSSAGQRHSGARRFAVQPLVRQSQGHGGPRRDAMTST